MDEKTAHAIGKWLAQMLRERMEVQMRRMFWGDDRPAPRQTDAIPDATGTP